MAFPVHHIRASGRSPSRFLRGDGRWADPASGSVENFRVAGQYYTSYTAGTPGAAAPTINFITAVPFIVSAAESFDRLAFYKHNNGTATAVAWVAVYRNKDPLTTPYPGELVVQGAVHATDSTEINGAGLFVDTINITLTPGIYWLVFCCGVAGQASVNSCSVNVDSCPLVLPVDLSGVPTYTNRYRGAFTYQASAPDPFPASIAGVTTTQVPLPFLRRA